MGNFSNLIPTSLGETIAVAIIKDHKPSGTDGGTFTNGARRTRDLNTITSDENSIVTLNANQFTLQAGTYVIEASAPAFKVDKHTAFIRNVTDGVDVAISQAQRDDATIASTGQTFAVGSITINAPKVFEIQHECQTTFASSGFGQSANFSVGVFTQVKITKIVPVVSSGVVAPVGAVAIIEDQKPNGTYGGSSVVGWQTRDLNTITYDGDSIINSLSSNEFVLDVGSYVIEVLCPNYQTQSIQSAISVDGVRAFISTSGNSSATGGNVSTSILAHFNSTGSEVLRVDNYCGIVSVDSGLGVRSNIGEIEIYTQIKITKKAE